MKETILKMFSIDKFFTGVRALNKVDFELQKGEVHSLVGENGAGKSTLMKILTGIDTKDNGNILLFGKNYSPESTKEALDLGIAIVNQELNMMEHLTVAQNIFIGREFTKGPRFWLDEKTQNEKTQNLLKELKIDINATEKLRNLTVGKQQMVEIAKAVSRNLKILVLDEPTSALTSAEIKDLFDIVKNLSEKGVSIIYISHRLDEVKAISDRVTVLRDGKNIATKNIQDVTEEEIINYMVGRVNFVKPKLKSNVSNKAETVLKVTNLNAGKLVQNVSFDLKKGEILGFSGLMGSGRTETARALFGADISTGLIEKDGKEIKINSPIDAIQNGLGYLSEDRKRFGLCINLSLEENELLASYEKLSKSLVINEAKMKKIVDEFTQKLSIKTPSINQIVRHLSGGNQQKVIIAKWLIRDCDILIFDEPTRGIDVGAKNEIYLLIKELVKSGKSIIMISSELEEVLRLSDRVAVMCEGRLRKILNIEDATQEKIMSYATIH